MRHTVQPRTARLLRRRAGAALAVPAALGVLISAPAAGIAAGGVPEAQDQAEAHASAAPAPGTGATEESAPQAPGAGGPAADEVRAQGIADPDGGGADSEAGDAGGGSGDATGGGVGESGPAPAGAAVQEQCTPSAVVNNPGGAPAEGSVPAYLVGQALSIEASGWCSAPGTALEEPGITLTVHGPAGAASYETEYVLVLVGSGEHAGVGGGDIDFEELLDSARSLSPGAEIPSTGTFSLTFTAQEVSVTTGLFTVSEPTPDPQPDPEPSPTAEPSPEPTGGPTAAPSGTPSAAPTAPPTTAPPTTPPAPACVPEDASLTLVGAQEGREPAYGPQDTITFAGRGWCSPQGALEEGTREVALQIVGRGGYGSEVLTVPVEISQGAFRVELPEQLRRSAERSTSNSFYLQVTYEGRTAGSSYFTLVKDALVDPPSTPPTAPPTSDPQPDPEPSPTAEPSPGPSVPPAAPPVTGSPTQSSTQPPAEPPATSSSTQGAEPGASISSPAPAESEPPSEAQEPQPQPAPAEDSGQAQRQEPAASAQPAPIGRPTPQQVLEAEDPATQDAGATAADRAGESDEAGTAAQAAAQSSTAVDPKARPTATPQAPVTSASELSAENAGSLSGARQGNLVTLILPSSAVSQGEWVSVFVFPGGQSPGWVQVDASNSVAIDISTLSSGSYELVVANRDNLLLGWARLEIAEASYAPGEVRQARVLPGAQAPVGPGYIGPDDWLLIGAGGLLVLGAASFLVAARSGVAAIRG